MSNRIQDALLKAAPAAAHGLPASPQVCQHSAGHSFLSSVWEFCGKQSPATPSMASARCLIFLSAAVCCSLAATFDLDTASIIRNSLTQGELSDDSLPSVDLDELTVLNMLEPLVKELQSWNITVSELNATACSCRGQTCSCCFRLSVRKFRLDKSACAQVTYLPRNYGVAFSFTLGGKVIFRKEISLRNPPDICFPVSGIPVLRLCVNLYDIRVRSSKLHLCIKLKAKAVVATILTINVGCFNAEAVEKHTLKQELLLLTSETEVNNEPDFSSPDDFSLS